MSGRGPAPKDPSQRRRANAPALEWQNAGGIGWRHGEVPPPPSKMTKAARVAWATWMSAWWAWFWELEDVPALRHLVVLYDRVERGEYHRHAELRQCMDAFGITPKGRAERRWRPPAADAPEVGQSGVALMADYRAAVGE